MSAPRTVPEGLFFRMLQHLGPRSVEVRDDRRMAWVGEHGETIAEADVEPLFVYEAGHIEWTTSRTDLLAHQLPVPSSLSQAGELALSMGERIDALSVQATAAVAARTGEPPAVTFYALHELRVLAYAEPVDKRAARTRAYVCKLLRDLGEQLGREIDREGTATGLDARRRIDDHARLLHAIARYLVPDALIATDIAALGDELAAWAIASEDEADARRLQAELDALTKRWDEN